MKQVYFLMLFFFVPVFLFSQPIDTVGGIKHDTLLSSSGYNEGINAILEKNKLLNFKAQSVEVSSNINKKSDNQTLYFYFIMGIALFLAFFKFFYTRYFNNLFRVFFNTSLRQNQLTDQLLQAKQASMFFNIFFILAGGSYVYFLLNHFDWLPQKNVLSTLSLCILSVGVVYLVKYLTLKFTGWITAYKEPINTYVFIVFLINKILGIFLIPFIVIIAFAQPSLTTPAVYASLFLIGLMLLFRFVRSYGLLQNRLRVSKMHFLLYITGIEIIPLLLIYKGLMILLNKNL